MLRDTAPGVRLRAGTNLVYTNAEAAARMHSIHTWATQVAGRGDGDPADRRPRQPDAVLAARPTARRARRACASPCAARDGAVARLVGLRARHLARQGDRADDRLRPRPRRPIAAGERLLLTLRVPAGLRRGPAHPLRPPHLPERAVLHDRRPARACVRRRPRLHEEQGIALTVAICSLALMITLGGVALNQAVSRAAPLEQADARQARAAGRRRRARRRRPTRPRACDIGGTLDIDPTQPELGAHPELHRHRRRGRRHRAAAPDIDLVDARPAHAGRRQRAHAGARARRGRDRRRRRSFSYRLSRARARRARGRAAARAA